MKKNKTPKPVKPDTKPNDSPKPGGLPSPKRGAFPTPKEDIEKSKPYIPDSDQTNGHQSTQTNGSANEDAEKS
jgi:hypothetical protein